MRTEEKTTVSRRHSLGAAALAAILSMSATLGSPSTARADLVSDLYEAQERCAALYDEVDRAGTELGDTQARLDELDARISEIEQGVEDDRKTLREKMRESYKTGPVTGWDAVMKSETIEGMIANAEYSARMRDTSQASVQAVMDATAELRQARDDLRALRDEQKARKDEVDERLRQTNEYVATLDAQLQEQLGAGRQAIANAAVQLAGTASPDPYIAGGQCERPSDPRLRKYVEEHDAAYPGDPYWASCDRCSGTAVQASGVDDSFPAGPPSNQYSYCEDSPNWKNVGSWSYGESCDKLEPGDVLITLGDHIKIYVGNEAAQARFPGSDANMYSGSAGQHQPWLYDESSSHDSRTYAIFRYVGLS